MFKKQHTGTVRIAMKPSDAGRTQKAGQAERNERTHKITSEPVVWNDGACSAKVYAVLRLEHATNKEVRACNVSTIKRGML